MGIKRYDSYTSRSYTLDEYIADCYGGLPNESMLEEQWKKLPIDSDYNSEADTLYHIKRVNELLSCAAIELLKRGMVHDESKLCQPEKHLFDKMTPMLADSTYGSDNYKELLSQLKPALDHHYLHNSHHPEHYENGVDGMCLFDLVEMFFDWKAASERHNDGDIYRSIEINQKRFNLSEQVANLFKNTAQSLGY